MTAGIQDYGEENGKQRQTHHSILQRVPWDKLSAARELIEGGEIHVLTGDYLAELTMALLF